MTDEELVVEIRTANPQLRHQPVFWTSLPRGPDGVFRTRLLMELDSYRREVPSYATVQQTHRGREVAMVGVLVVGAKAV